MGSYTFKWEYPDANEVIVTGTFDQWKQTTKLEKTSSGFEKTVDVPTDQKILYKFLINGSSWQLDKTKPSETDAQGNTNNVLFPSDIKPHPTSHTMSGVTPDSTTAALAAKVPKEADKQESSSAADASAPEPTPSNEGLPGAFPETPGGDFSVNPIPATGGTGNPVQLAPGEKVPDPSKLTSNTVESTVKTDKASYENADSTVAAAPPAKVEGSSAGAGGMMSVPPLSKNTIPESSLPMNADKPSDADANAGPTMQSAAPGSTTAQLAGAVPKEPRGQAEEVDANQLGAKSEQKQDETTTGKLAGMVSGGIAAATAAVTGTAVAAKDKAGEATGAASEAVTKAIKTEEPGKVAEGVPDVVADSQVKAKEPPEAAASKDAVEAKNKVEGELKKNIPVGETAAGPSVSKKVENGEGAGPAAATGSEAEGKAKAKDGEMERKKKNRRSRIMDKLKKMF